MNLFLDKKIARMTFQRRVCAAITMVFWLVAAIYGWAVVFAFIEKMYSEAVFFCLVSVTNFFACVIVFIYELHLKLETGFLRFERSLQNNNKVKG